MINRSPSDEALRESINAAVSELLRRRPNQEPARKLGDKIKSIGRQCNYEYLNQEHFEGIATNAEVLVNECSEMKQTKVTRNRLKELSNRGLLILYTLLSSIDENRLRRPSS